MTRKETLIQEYKARQEKGQVSSFMDCFLFSKDLGDVLTGTGLSLAKELYPDFYTVDVRVDGEDKYRVWKLAKNICENDKVDFFAIYTRGNGAMLTLEVWGNEELITAMNLVGNPEFIVDMLSGKKNFK